MKNSNLVAKTQQLKESTHLSVVPNLPDNSQVGDFELLDIFRQIKRLSQKEEYVDLEIGDQLWRLADKGQQTIEARS